MNEKDELRRIAHELRTYNPVADEYKGTHIHMVWAREIDAVIKALSRPAEAQPVLRVCAVSDIECSHGCGTGQCKKEAQPVARVPEGLKLVPSIATAEMLIAGSVAIGMDPLPAGGEDGYAITGEQSTMRKCYEAMLAAAAPQAPAASAEQTGTSHMGRVPESRKPFRCDMSAVAKAPALSASEQHARSTVRVCEVSDAQCSRGCGTGLCASEQQSAYETFERHRIAGGYVPNDVRTVPALNANQCVLPELKTTGEPTQKPDGLAWALAALQAVDSERTEEDADVHDQNSAATQAINDRILAIAEDAPDPCRTILRNLIEFIDKEGPEAKQWEPISKLCERGWQALDGDHTAADGIPRAAEDAGGDEIELATFEFDLKTFEASLRGLVEHSREWEKAYHDGSKLYEELDPYKSTVEQELRYLVKQFREQLEREASTLRQFRRYAAIHPAPANKAVGLTDEQIIDALESAGVEWQWAGFPTAHRMTSGSIRAEKIVAGVRALLAAAQPSAGEQPSLTNPLTPYGMLVRALRIVAGTTLYDMAKHFAGGPARLSAIEFGRMTATEAVVARTAEYFAGLGIHDTLPALNAALLAAAPAEAKGGKS